MAALALLLVAHPAAASPVFFELTLDETSPGSAQYAGTFSIDSSVLESGKALSTASIGIDLTLAGLVFTTASSASSLVALDQDGLAYVVADFPADPPDYELHLGGPDLEWDLFEAGGRDPIRSGTYSFSIVPEPSTLLLVAVGLVALRFHSRRARGA
jgi:hypothetical protein